MGAAVGKRIYAVHDADHGYYRHACRTVAPSESKLFNFDVVAGGLSLLVLDPYGDETLWPDDRERLFGRGESHTLAICRKTGEIYHVGFARTGGKLVMVIWKVGQVTYTLPKRWLTQLDKLKSAKRPFDLSIRDSALVSFAHREIGYKELAGELIVRLWFGNVGVEVWGDSYRAVTKWKDV